MDKKSETELAGLSFVGAMVLVQGDGVWWCVVTSCVGGAGGGGGTGGGAVVRFV